ncbi:MAG: hypothetical protein COU46_03245 [Candidatus Niyogibacteria bacterium CG10_big_fil_rev_8_21_14_0_10_42_19]|uniref:Leucine-binding protein domain-containing protein n=1 Tax=Candidatus Niyogibacteria bacterium CG10_big_fil_rev_8_21_14_0_10_42_19 TaxID=1974725 RepID=A0A2H0TF17_9BACT|nr:MAG: hypothetical protein COU46_03245 [Candidatus Niyogibacteria bacterium CG10_big_fil_rev_8_21_14_0_10_42_19]
MDNDIFKRSSIFKKAVIAFIVVASFIVSYTLYILRPVEKESIKIGAILPLSGAAFYIGEEVKDGMLLALDEINIAGGINGKQIDLIIEDSGNDPREGRDAFDRIEERHKPLLYISALESVSLALAPLAELNQVVLAGLVVVDPLFTKRNEWTFKYYLQAEEEVKPIISTLEKMHIKKLGVMYLDDQYGNSVLELLQSKFEKNGGEITSVGFTIDETDFTDEIKNLSGNDAIYSVGFESHFRNIFSQLRKQNYEGVILGSSAASVPFIRSAPEAEGIYIAAPITYNENFLFAKEINDKYRAKYGKESNHYAANGYDFIKILENLFKGRETLTRRDIKILLEERFLYTGVFGVIDVIKSGSRDITFSLYPARIKQGGLDYSP